MTHSAFFPGHDVGVFAAVNKVDFRMFYGMSSPRTTSSPTW